MAGEPKRRAGKAIALPFRTFAEIEAHGLELQVWCSGCHTIRRLELEPAYRNRVFAGARLICKRLVAAQFGSVGRVTCNSIGHLQIRLPQAIDPSLAIECATLACPKCVPPWEVGPIPRDWPTWAEALATSGAYFVCPACHTRLNTFWSGGAGVPFSERFRR